MCPLSGHTSHLLWFFIHRSMLTTHAVSILATFFFLLAWLVFFGITSAIKQDIQNNTAGLVTCDQGFCSSFSGSQTNAISKTTWGPTTGKQIYGFIHVGWVFCLLAWLDGIAIIVVSIFHFKDEVHL